MNFILRDDIKIIFLTNNQILFGNKIAKKITLSSSDYALLNQMSKKFNVYSDSDCPKKLLNILRINNLILPIKNNSFDAYGTNLERTQLFLHTCFNNKNLLSLKGKHILLIGAGGIACEIINQLLAVGISDFSIIDYDVVELSNLNRQFIYSFKDVGQKKIDILKKYILDKYPKSNVYIYDNYILDYKTLSNIINNKKIDFIVNCADNPPYLIQKIILETAINFNIPCIFGGVGLKSGSYGPLLANNFIKKLYLKKNNDILKKIVDIYPCKSSFGVTNSIISNYMSWDIIMYLLGEKKYIKSLNKTIDVDFIKNHIYEKNIS